MRVLMISDVYFPRINGVSTSIQTFARELSAQGHQITLIAPEYGTSEPEPFEVIRVASRYLPLDPEDRILRTGKLRAYRPRLAAAGFHLIHIQTPFIAHYAGLGLARRFGLPVVESYHTFFEQYLDKYIPFVPSAWLRAAARRFSASQCNAVDALVVPSRAMLDVLHGYGVGTHAEVIPTGIELDRFSSGDGARFRERHDIAPARPVLVHVGRLAFEKNIDFLLHVLVRVRRQVPDVLLVIAGEGPARRELEALSTRLGLRDHVLFVGYLSRDGALEDCYCAGAAFVFASRTETQGLVLLEAMALGVPVVSTAIMGTREVLDDGRGCLIAEDDEADFASKAVRLLTEPELRAALAAEAHRYAQGWSAPVLAERMIQFYEEVANRAKARRTGPSQAE
ncbi:MAG: glycosyltransferase [Chromatiaceae bacterium]|jgi:glycosyltransferase involved in cell wall biosynthesis|nr:glycosyltransferase [Chromatiaceae bacterium]